MDKKKLILTIIAIILFLIVLVLAYLLFQKYVLKKNFETDILSFANKNQNTVFKIDKITLFSSCDAKNKSISNTNFTIENLYQYTDIALFISSSSEEKNSENTFKKVYIDNFQYITYPTDGEPKLYYKNINNFAKSDIIDENLIQDRLDFDITSQDEANLDKPTLYNNLANPIVLSYVNSNIKTDYTLTDTSSPITYDGSLLKKCNVLLNNITCKFSFDIYITNHLDQEFKCSVYIDVPLETEDKTIYEGNITLKKENANFIFYRYK